MNRRDFFKNTIIGAVGGILGLSIKKPASTVTGYSWYYCDAVPTNLSPFRYTSCDNKDWAKMSTMARCT